MAEMDEGSSPLEDGCAQVGVIDPGTDREFREVVDGLRAEPRTISSKYFYDRVGSELFEEITQLAEYYPTRTEHMLLDEVASVWVAERKPTSLVELGAGSGQKTRTLLRAMTSTVPSPHYVPVDVSEDFLHLSAESIGADHPTVAVEPIVADITRDFEFDESVGRPMLVAFLGSTIGNFEESTAIELLRRVRRSMRPSDALLLGVDLRPSASKSKARLEAAYNDAGGVTARFNLNALRVLASEFGIETEVEDFRHLAFYNEAEHRIEMHLEAVRELCIEIPGESDIVLRQGETIRTEISCKHDRESVVSLLARSDLGLERWRPDPDGLYAILLATSI